jgi:tripartite-type tricarboxylate transporter receptor subunit TctC
MSRLPMTRMVVALLAALGCAGEAAAQAYPSRPIRIIVPNPPGGSADVLSRLLSTRLAQDLGQPVVIENRAGANGIVGTDAVIKSPADGYTLLLGSNSQYSVNPAIYAKLPYDPLKDLSLVSQISEQPLMVLVNPKVPANNLQELVKLAKSRPGKLNYGGSGPAATLPVEHFNAIAGIKIQEVPYRGGGPATIAAISGEVEVFWATVVSIFPQAQAGKLRALAVSSERRSSLAPDLPTIAEQGYPGYEASVWHAVAGPAGMPKPVVDRLNAELQKLLTAADVKEMLSKQGVESVPSTPAKLEERIRSEIVRWQRVVKDANIKQE